MWRFLSVLGLLLALCGAGVRPAEAYPAQRTAVLSGSPCTNKIASLDFAANSGNGVYCLNRTRYSSPTFIPGLASSRASTGYAQTSAGTLVSFGSGVPRITDLGLLDELSATNLLLRSQTLGTAPWAVSGATVPSVTATTAPDGTLTGNSLVENAAGTTHQMNQTVSVTLSQAYAYSIYLKANTRTWAWVEFYDTVTDHTAYINLSTGAVGTTASATVTVDPLANGWYRVKMAFTSAATSAGASAVIGAASGNGGRSYSGDGASGIYVWGAQLETGTAASSYIPTTSAAVTRAADALTLTYSPAGSAATVTYGTNSTASPSPTSPINLGSSSSGAWVGNYIRKLVVTP